MFSSGIKILVVDDMLTMRKIIKNTLKELGFEKSEEASDGVRAWEAMEKAHSEGVPYDLVLCDWNMPRLPGIELLKQVRADERFKSLPFILITAESDQSQVLQAIKLGVSNYLVKPFNKEDLQDRLESTHKRMTGAA